MWLRWISLHTSTREQVLKGMKMRPKDPTNAYIGCHCVKLTQYVHYLNMKTLPLLIYGHFHTI